MNAHKLNGKSTYPYAPPVTFALSALTLKWSKTMVTCSFGVAKNLYVQFVSNKNADNIVRILKLVGMFTFSCKWLTRYIFWRKPWTIEFTSLTWCTSVCECTWTVRRCRTWYLIFCLKCILGLEKEWNSHDIYGRCFNAYRTFGIKWEQPKFKWIP